MGSKKSKVETVHASEADPRRPAGRPAALVLIYRLLLPVARRHGYALALHGSLARDLDVVAVPWVEDAAPAAILVEALRETIDGFIVSDPRAPEKNPALKPHGRMGWAIHLMEGGYVDLSVIPPARDDGGGE
jgi:hypothetical protein